MKREGAKTQRGYCSEFVLIDLFSQYDAVYRYIEGWSIDEIFDWVAQYGDIVGIKVLPELVVGDPSKFEIDDESVRYNFMPHCCLYMISRFQIQNGKFQISHRLVDVKKRKYLSHDGTGGFYGPYPV